MMKTKKRSSTTSKHLNVVVLGQVGVGKSAFTVRLKTRRFIWEYSKIEDSYNHCIEHDGENVSLTITDTSGLKSEKELEDYLGIGDLYIIMYSITDRSSFLESRRLGNFLRENNSGNFEMALVGNKTDLEHARQILESEGTSLSEELECKFYEISVAKNFFDVEFMMNDAVKGFTNQKSDCRSSKTSLLKVKENLARNKSFKSFKRRMSIS